MGNPQHKTNRHRVGQADRIFVDAPVTLKADQAGVEGVAYDVSENGIKIVTDTPPGLGPVTVKLVGLPSVAGEIRWRAAGLVGVQLSYPLAPDVLADWIKYHGSGHR